MQACETHSFYADFIGGLCFYSDVGGPLDNNDFFFPRVLRCMDKVSGDVLGDSSLLRTGVQRVAKRSESRIDEL